MTHDAKSPLTAKDELVFDVIRHGPAEGMGPTAIGLAFGKPYMNASSAVMGNVRKLVAAGVVERHVPKGGVVLYRAVPQ